MSAENSAKNRLPTAGFLLVDKPQGVTSHDVVAACRGALHTRHVGHAGTLDPMATGLLVIGFGAATRLLNFVVGKVKTYEAVIRLGATSTTDDAEGSVSEQTPEVTEMINSLKSPLGVARIDDVIATHLSGTIEQVPSSFSAIKVHGMRAYDLARAGKKVELAARPITISGFERLESTTVSQESGERYLDMRVRITCSAGTYIRAIARDLGDLLGVGGYLTFLRRTHIGDFDVAQAVVATTQEKTFTDREGNIQRRLKVSIDADDAARNSIDAARAISAFMPVCSVTDEQAYDLQFGRSIAVSVSEPTAALLKKTDSDMRLCAIVEPGKDAFAHPTAVFPQEA